MVFSSALFLFVFLPTVLGGYFLLHERYRNLWLLLASLFFYSWGEPKYIILMLVSITSNYILAFGIDLFKKPAIRKLMLFFDVVINIGLLGYFKYYGFFATNINSLAGSELIPLKNIVLPIGISFYTFQSMSYVIDVYWKKVPVQKSIIKLGLYVSLFPQLIAGPIVRYIDIEKEISCRKVTYENFYAGIRRFMVGFSKKVLIADQLAPLVDLLFQSNGYSGLAAWIGAIAYSLQIFFDFSGYSDMAIGLGKVFGFTFLENFNYPYISSSIQEFWRRWHISLSSWFRDYVYIPLGGSRKGNIRTYINIVIVFLLTGFWHGASWNFVVWGLYYVIFQVIERLFLSSLLKKAPAFVGHIYALFFVIIGWVFFRAEDLTSAVKYIGNMFVFNKNILYPVIVNVNAQYCFCMLAGILFSTPIMPKVKEKMEKARLGIVCDLAVVITFVIAISYLLGKGFSPFLYFRF